MAGDPRGGARVRVRVLPRAHPHPREPRDAVPGRRRAAARVQPPVRPVRGRDPRRRGHRDDPGRPRDHPRAPARADRLREGGCQRRPPVGRAAAVRRRRRLERGGDAQPRRRPGPALRADARARRGDAGDLARRRGELRGAPRELRAHLVVAQARPAPRPADPRRRQRRQRCSTACWPTATTGCPTWSAATTCCSRASRSCAAAPIARSASRSTPRRRARSGSSATREAGVERCVFYVPSAGADAVEAKIERVLDSAAQVGLR